MENVLIQFDNVSYAAGEKRILADINWSVKKGEHWAVIGPNGAGKSTLLKLIYGFLWPNVSGNIYRKEKEYINLGELRKSIGWVTSDLIQRIPPGEKVLETVLSGEYAMFGFYANPFLNPDENDTEAALAIMHKLGIAQFRDRITQTLSQGEIQKALLARSLMSKPYLVMLDEPTIGLDPGARENFLQTLDEYIANHSEPSFIYVTHHIEEITDGFKKILILKDRRMFLSGNTEGTINDETVSCLYDYPFRVTRNNKRYNLINNTKNN